MLTKDADLVAGKEPFRGYTLRKVLGEGTFGVVWEATKESGEGVALKFLPSADSNTIRQEIKAIEMIGRLRHPNLIKVYDVWSYKKYFVVAMELADGSLLDLVDAYGAEYGTAVDIKDLCPLLMQAAGAIDFLNRRTHILGGRSVALQHCDIKPSNLLLFGDTVKLADFGLVSIATLPVNFHRPTGTLAYMAPELIMGRLSDRSDQFSLAVSYVQLRTGKLPWPVEEPAATQGKPVWPAPELGALTAVERPIIARALSNVPQDRWGSCTEMMTNLTQSIKKVAVIPPKTTQQGLSNRPTFHDRPKRF